MYYLSYKIIFDAVKLNNYINYLLIFEFDYNR